MLPTLIIHGGAGVREGSHARFEHYAGQLQQIIEQSYPVLLSAGARAAVIHAIRLLEDDPLFNAGTGSRLQRDGQVRMSAALMDSRQQVFAGVINIERVRHPIAVAEQLGSQRHSVLAAAQATAYARAAGFGEHDPVTEHRRLEFEQQRQGSSGTVGAVAIDGEHIICAGTSTGGVGWETPGRVSDSATVAGTYASAAAGVSCTGSGEQIVNHAAAARIVTRIEDGLSRQAALAKTIAEADVKRYSYGVICLDSDGGWSAQQTRGVTTLFAVHAGQHITTFL
jgi:L-asparaginase